MDQYHVAVVFMIVHVVGTKLQSIKGSDLDLGDA